VELHRLFLRPTPAGFALEALRRPSPLSAAFALAELRRLFLRPMLAASVRQA